MTPKDEPEKDGFFSQLIDPILEAIHRDDLNEEQAEALIHDLLETGPASLIQSLKDAAPEMLDEEATAIGSFQARNYQRWKKPIDLLTMLHRVSSEISHEHAKMGPQGGDPFVFDTLARSTPRALLVTSEILHLLKGGYADAALARWRTLHEITVVSHFIEKHGREAAIRYRLGLEVERFNAARQYNEYAERAGLQPFTPEDLAELEARKLIALKEIGEQRKGDWSWAAKDLKKGERHRVTFVELEKDVELDHWRPRVKWASQNTHANFRDPMSTLGMSEADDMVFQVGPSNSGLVDPLHMTAISLNNVTTKFLMYPEVDFERLIFVKVLLAIADEIGASAVAANEKTEISD